MAKDKNGNKKSMVSLSLQKGRIISHRYDMMFWWLDLWSTALYRAQKENIDRCGYFDHEREMINTELSAFDYELYQNGGAYYV